jgi:uncharacterized protein
VIHGTADATIPVEQAVQIYQRARPPKELWLAEGAGHCGAYFQDRSLYSRRAVNFFLRYLDVDEGDGSDAVQDLRGEELA